MHRLLSIRTICLASRISEPPARSVNVDIQCINVRSVKNKATYVADLVSPHDIDIFDGNMARQRRGQPCNRAAGSRRLQVSHLLRSAVVEWLSFTSPA